MNYTNLTWEELLNKTKNWFDLPRVITEALKRLKDLISANQPNYKVYTALLTQSGTDAPVATVLENTLGEITFSYEDVGTYNIISNGLFIEGKTWYDINSASETGSMLDGLGGLKRTDINNISVLTVASGADATNDILNNTPIEIKVYN